MVTRTKFLAAVAANPKSKWFKFIQLFFKSKKTNTVYYSYLTSLFVLFAIMFYYGLSPEPLGYFPTWPIQLQISSILFIVLVVGVAVPAYILAILDQQRIKRICKILNISLFEYDELCNKYEKDIK